jgi:cation:H+ antiporter
MISFAGTILGVAILIGGGVLLVRGASEIATRFGISPMIVGLTIVSFGTSAPELVVNVLGALKGETALAFGNVIGSNISNLGLVLGMTTLIAPIAIQGTLVRRELPLLLLGTTVLTVMALDGLLEGYPPAIGRSDSIVLLLMFCIFIYLTAMDFLRTKQSDRLLDDIVESHIVRGAPSLPISLLFLFLGCVLLFAGGELTVRNASAIASDFGISPTVVGLFVVAIGTSMPELVTSIVAALRRESDLALGNVIGSNIFNSLFVLPVSGLVKRIAIPEGGLGDLAVSWALAAILIPIFFFGKGRIGRLAGVFFLLAYVAYAIIRVNSPTG